MKKLSSLLRSGLWSRLFWICLLIVISFARCEREKATQVPPGQHDPFEISVAFAKKIAVVNYSFTESTKVGKSASTARTSVAVPTVETVETLTNEGYDVIHIINYKDNKGWAIISADRRVVPVLAYLIVASLMLKQSKLAYLTG